MRGGRQITKKECRSRTPFVSPEIFPCDLIAGKESWRANDEERCPSRLLQIEGGGGESSHRWMTVLQTLGTISTNGWNCSRTIYNRVSARHPRRGRRGGRPRRWNWKETCSKIFLDSSVTRPRFSLFLSTGFFIPLQFASRKLCIPRARPQILRIVEFSIPLTAFHFPQIQRISQRRERER